MGSMNDDEIRQQFHMTAEMPGDTEVRIMGGDDGGSVSLSLPDGFEIEGATLSYVIDGEEGENVSVRVAIHFADDEDDEHPYSITMTDVEASGLSVRVNDGPATYLEGHLAEKEFPS